MLIPCHNETLDWVDSATDAPRHGGFNAFGRAVIGECNRLGMIVDGAHVSHDGIRRLLDVSEAPILLSHSNAFSLCDHPRNAPDDVLKRLKENGGAVLATFVPGFVSQAVARLAQRLRSTPTARRRRSPIPKRGSPRSKRATARRRARRWPRSPTRSSIWSRPRAIDHVGIGSDFYGGPQPQGLEHVGRFPHLFAELIRRGFSERDLEKIANRNILRVMRKVEQVGERSAGSARAGGGPDRGLSGAVRATARRPSWGSTRACSRPSDSRAGSRGFPDRRRNSKCIVPSSSGGARRRNCPKRARCSTLRVGHWRRRRS